MSGEGDAAAAAPKKSIDLQYLALRTNYAFQQTPANRWNLKGVSFKLFDIRRNLQWNRQEFGLVMDHPFYSDSVPALWTVPDLVLNKFVLHSAANGENYQPSLETFIPPNSGLATALSLMEKEEIYWRIALQVGYGTVTIGLYKVIQELAKAGIGFTGRFNGTIEKVDANTIGFRGMRYLPHRQINFVEMKQPRQEVPGFLGMVLAPLLRPLWSLFEMKCIIPLDGKIPGRDYGDFCSLAWADQEGVEWALNPAGLQFGLRGAKKELVGNWEKFDDYSVRFENEIAPVSGMSNRSLEHEKINFARDYGMFQKELDPFVNAVIEDVKGGKTWCFYCGKLVEADPDPQKFCGACGVAVYCGDYCKSSDSSAHETYCVPKLVEIVLED